MAVEPVELLQVLDHAFEKKDRGKGCARCGHAKTHMDHVGAPQSLNVFGSGANHFAYQHMKHAWQERLTRLLDGSGLPAPIPRVVVEGECCFPDRRRRDQGNHRFIVEKALGDALTAGGWLEDDDWTRYEFGGLAFRYEKGVSWTRLIVLPFDVDALEQPTRTLNSNVRLVA